MKRSTGGTPISLFKLATFPIDKQLTLEVQLRQHEVLDQLYDARPPLLHLLFDDNENSIWSPIITRSSQGSNGSGSPASQGPQPWYFWDLSRWLFGSRPPRVVRVSPGGPVPLEELESGTRMTSSLQRTKNKQIWNLRVINTFYFKKVNFMKTPWFPMIFSFQFQTWNPQLLIPGTASTNCRSKSRTCARLL